LQESQPERIFSSIVFGAVTADPALFVAPLAGISDRSFRRICRRNGAGMVFTEMVAAEALVRDNLKTWNLARFEKDEHPIGIQLFSHDPVVLGEASGRLAEINPDAIDLNFGCPVKKVVRRGAGAGFLEDLDRLSRAVREVVKASSIPVTVKLRSGPTPDRINAVEAARRAEDEGASVITLHARTTNQFFRGRADWTIIKAVKQAVKIPVIGNGDIASPEDAVRMREETGCDGMMIGRGALGKPWFYAACDAALNGKEFHSPSMEEKWKTISEHYKMLLADKGVKVGLLEMRKHLGWYSKGLPGAAKYRALVVRMANPEDVLKATEEFFLNSKLIEAESD